MHSHPAVFLTEWEPVTRTRALDRVRAMGTGRRTVLLIGGTLLVIGAILLLEWRRAHLAERTRSDAIAAAQHTNAYEHAVSELLSTLVAVPLAPSSARVDALARVERALDALVPFAHGRPVMEQIQTTRTALRGAAPRIRDDAMALSLLATDSLRVAMQASEYALRGQLQAAAINGTYRVQRLDRLTFSGNVLAAALLLSAVLVGARHAQRRSTAEEARRELERRNAMALRAGRMGWWRYTPNEQRLEWSVEMGPLYGRPSGWQPSVSEVLSLVHPDDVPRVRADFDAILAHEGGAVEAWRIVWPDGSTRWVEGDVIVEREHTGALRCATGIVRDVTDLLDATTLARRAEELLRTALDAMADGVIVRVDGEPYAAFANRAAAEILGVSDDEVGLPFGDASRWSLADTLGRPISASEVVTAQAFATGEQRMAFYHLHRPDGLWRWIQARAVPFAMGKEERRAVMVSFTDLTDLRSLQRHSEQLAETLAAQNRELEARTEALAESEGRLRAILSSMHEGVVVRAEDGRILLSNPAAVRMLGRAPGWLSGQREHEFADDLYTSDGARLDVRDHPAMVALLTGAPVEDFVMGVRRSSGELAWLRVNAIPQFRADDTRAHAVVATFSDITHLRETERALAERESHYRLMATGIRDVVSLTDPSGTLQWVSPSVTSMLGWEPEALIGTSVQALLHPDEVARIDRRQQAEPVREGDTQLLVQNRLRRVDGEYVWAETTFTVVRDDAGAIIGHLRVTRDVTERRAMEQQLSQSERLRAVGTLAGGLAHDFNNVLTVVRATAEHLMEATPSGSVREELHTILQASDRAQSLTKQMLTFARGPVRLPTGCVVDEVLAASAPLFATLLRTPGQLRFELLAPNASVRVDPDELTTAVMNLVANARDALPEGGQVIISTAITTSAHSAGDTDAALDVELAPVDVAAVPHLRLTVRDTGIGMPEDVRQRACEPFFTTKPLGEGTGLGLATVHGVCRASGGAVSIQSAPGEGTAVSMWLPVAPLTAEPDAVGNSDGDASTGATRTLRLIVVDDEPPLRAVMARLARRAGHSVQVASSAAEALVLLEADGDQIDAIVTDQLMPGLSGRQLVQSVHARWPHIPCALVSGYTAEDDVAALVDGGRNLFLEKPFTTAGFLRLLEQLGTHRRNLLPGFHAGAAS